MYVVIKNHAGSKWTEIKISSDDEAAEMTIGALAKKRISQSQKYRYLGYMFANLKVDHLGGLR